MDFIQQKYKNVVQLLDEHKAIKDEVKSAMVEALEEFKAVFKAAVK